MATRFKYGERTLETCLVLTFSLDHHSESMALNDEIDALLAYVIAEIQSDIKKGYEECLYDFLSRMPRHYLIGYLSENRGDEALAKGIITEAEHEAAF